MMTHSERTHVFVSYSHQDAEWLRRLRVHLRPLEIDHEVEIWDDTMIEPGLLWREKIEQAITPAKVAILLVSADFLASDFIRNNELPPLLKAAKEDGAVILPVILSPSRFHKVPSLAQFQAVNNPAKPLIGLTRNEQEAALVKVAAAVEAALGHAAQDESTALPDEERSAMPGPHRPSRMHLWLVVILLAGLVMLVGAYWRFVYQPSPAAAGSPPAGGTLLEYTGRVVDATNLQAVRNARVSVEAEGRVEVYYTDSEGVFRAVIKESAAPLRLRVDTAGYQVFSRNVSLPKAGVEEIRLTPAAAATTTPPAAPTSREKRSRRNSNSTRNSVVEETLKDLNHN